MNNENFIISFNSKTFKPNDFFPQKFVPPVGELYTLVYKFVADRKYLPHESVAQAHQLVIERRN